MPQIKSTQASRLTGTASSHTHSGAAGDGAKDLALGATGTVVFSDVTLSRYAASTLGVSGAGRFATGLTVAANGITVTGNSTITGTLGGVTTLTATTSVSTDAIASRTRGSAGIAWGLTGATIAGHTVAADDMEVIASDGGWRWVFASDASLWTSGGFIVGTATGGYTGAGTINTAGDIYKNNSAFTNPDYAIEHWLTGSIELFDDSPGAADYTGRLSLPDLKVYMQENYQLPRVSSARGMFERGDMVLEKIEEIFIHLIELDERITALETA